MKIKSVLFSLLLLCGQNNFLFSARKTGIKKRSPSEIAECAKIVGELIIASIAYGIVNDQITVRICPEYFSKGLFANTNMKQWKLFPLTRLKKILLHTKSPTIAALIWGTITTWWIGALLSIPVTLAARIGSWPKLTARDLKPTIIKGLMCNGIFAASAGIYGYTRAKNGTSILNNDTVSDNAKNNFIANAFAHRAAYLGGFLFTLYLTTWTVHKRYCLHKKQVKRRHLLTKVKTTALTTI